MFLWSKGLHAHVNGLFNFCSFAFVIKNITLPSSSFGTPGITSWAGLFLMLMQEKTAKALGNFSPISFWRKGTQQSCSELFCYFLLSCEQWVMPDAPRSLLSGEPGLPKTSLGAKQQYWQTDVTVRGLHGHPAQAWLSGKRLLHNAFQWLISIDLQLWIFPPTAVAQNLQQS